MNARAAALPLLLCTIPPLTSACESTRSQDTGVLIFDSAVREAYRQYERTLSAERTALRFESGQVADDCAGYLEEQGRSRIAEDASNRLVASEYPICDVVSVLRSSQPSGPDAFRPESYGEELHQRLDLRTFPSSLRARVDDEAFLMTALPELAPAVSKYAVVSDTEDWFLKLEVLAQVDADRDGDADWLLRLIDEARNGTYRDYRALLVSDVSEKGYLHAEPLH